MVQLSESILGRITDPTYKYGNIGITANKQSVCHETNWDRVEDDVVIFLFQDRDNLSETVSSQKFCWIGWYRSGLQQVEMLVYTRWQDLAVNIRIRHIIHL